MPTCIIKAGPVITSLTVTQTEIYSDEVVTVDWQTRGASSCRLNTILNTVTVPVNGRKSLVLSRTTTNHASIWLECSNSAGITNAKEVRVNFKDDLKVPHVTLTPSTYANVSPGSVVNIRWDATDYVDDGTLTANTDGCHFTSPASLVDWVQGVGYTSKLPTTGSISYTINSDTTFKMWCRGSITTQQGYSNDLVVRVLSGTTAPTNPVANYCKVSVSPTTFSTDSSFAVLIDSQGYSSVQYSIGAINGTPNPNSWVDFTTTKGTQVYPAGSLAPGTYGFNLRAKEMQGNGFMSCSPSSITLNVTP